MTKQKQFDKILEREGVLSISKSVQKIVFLVVMAISTVLLCFVGVWAAQGLNLKFTGIVNPDIICKIEVKNPNAENYITLFNNYGNGTAADFLDNQNHLKNFNATLDGTVANELEFKLTNYTPTKHIRLSIQDILIDGNTFTTDNLLTSHTSASAEKFTSGEADSNSFTLSLSANKNGTFTINLSLLVEEVYMVSTSGTGLANPDKFFFAEDESPIIPLSASVSYQLPQSVTFSKIVDEQSVTFVTNTTYIRTNNLEGKASFALSDLKDNVSILCNCDRVFMVEKSTSQSLFENSQSTMQGVVAAYDNTATYLPNNGKYTYSADYAQVTKGDNFQEYPYYINLGEYPQTQITDTSLISALNSYSLTNLAITTETRTINSTKCDIAWYEYNGQKYVKSTLVPYIPLSEGQEKSAWFYVEPITWIVLEAQSNGQSVALDTLYYDQTEKMFYVDALCGKAFTGQLVLLSAYTIDAYAFDSATTLYTNFGTSQIQTFLKNTIGSAYTIDGNSILGKMFYGYKDNDNYIPSKNLQTYSQTAYGSAPSKTSLASELFFLAGNNKDEEDFHASKYFSGAPGKDTSIQTTTLAVTSPTDYAIAHYIETSKVESTSNEVDAYNNPTNLASPRGWAVGTAPSSTYVCTYWTRSAYNINNSTSAMAHVVNTRGSVKATNIKDPHIGVRPCMVLDLNFYYSNIFDYS